MTIIRYVKEIVDERASLIIEGILNSILDEKPTEEYSISLSVDEIFNRYQSTKYPLDRNQLDIYIKYLVNDYQILSPVYYLFIYRLVKKVMVFHYIV